MAKSNGGFARLPNWPLLAQTVGLGQYPVVVAGASPAAAAGVLPGDIVLAIDGRSIAAITASHGAGNPVADALTRFVAERAEGEPVTFDIERGGSPLKLAVQPA